MSITDEIREWIRSLYTPNSAELKSEGLAIADRIDEEAEDNRRFRCEAEPFCDRLREASSERADVTLFDVGYIALPLDADGAPIHIGDDLEVLNEDKHGVVMGISYHSDGVPCIRLGSAYYWFEADKTRHYHKPTVGDVLREFAEKVIDSQIPGVHPTYEEAIAEYAAKLRLADGNEQ